MDCLAVSLPSGDVQVAAAFEEAATAPWAALALAHGAGAGMDHPFLVGFAAAMRDAGVATLRFEFPYRAAGRRMPGPASHAIATWQAVSRVLAAATPGLPQIAAGKSYGGRMASMAAAEGHIEPDALVYLGYPFHAPGKPDAERGDHLARITAPQLFVEGTMDPFIDPIERFEAAVATAPDAEIAWVPGGVHSFEVKGVKLAADDIGAELAASITLPWLRRRFGA